MEYQQSQKRLKRLIFGGVVGVLLLITLMTSVRSVDTGHIGVVTRYGRVTGRELKEGIHLVYPWGVDDVTGYDTKVLKEEADAAAASKDLQDVNAKLVINYRLEGGSISEIHQKLGPKYKEKVIDPAIQEVFKGASAKYDALQLITDRASIKKDAYEALQARLAGYEVGIVVQDLSIVNFSFSPEFTDAIEKKQVAQQQAQQAVFLAEKAKQEAQADIERARGQSESQRLLQATASAQTIELKRLEVQNKALDKWNGVLPSYWGGQGNELFNIPLQR